MVAVDQIATYRFRVIPRIYRYTRPGMKVSWWQYEVANELQRFYHCLKKERGRSWRLWLRPAREDRASYGLHRLGRWKEPDLKTIFASYSEELGADVNKALQHIMSSERYVSIFGVRLGDGRSRWVRNSNTLEYPYYGGSFYNTTVGGQITGKGLDLELVDDPVKGRAEAISKTVRDKLWQWFTDDFLTRFSDFAGLLMIMTRWHLDDPIGRLIEAFPDMKIFRYSAIAEEDERNRSKGEALFPEHKSKLLSTNGAVRWRADPPGIGCGSPLDDETVPKQQICAPRNGCFCSNARYVLRMVLHYGASSDRLHVTIPGIAHGFQFKAPVCSKASVLQREGPCLS